jgi:hypothetical protein
MPSIPADNQGDNRGGADPMAQQPVEFHLPPDVVRATGLHSFTVELPVGLVGARLPAWDPALSLEDRLDQIFQSVRRRVVRGNGPDPERPILWWEGEPHKLPPTPWGLLWLLWARESIAVEDGLLAAVWGEAPKDDALGHACRAVNKVLARCPHFTRGRLGLKNGRVGRSRRPWHKRPCGATRVCSGTGKTTRRLSRGPSPRWSGPAS